MQVRSFFLATALIALPSTAALAQSATAPSAPATDGAPAATASPAPGATGAAPATPSATVPAVATDVTPNAAVFDSTGAKVGTVESVSTAGAVVFTGTARAQIPIASFAKNAQGLVIGITKAQLEAAVAKAGPAKS